MIITTVATAIIILSETVSAQSLGFMSSRQTAVDGGLVEQIVNTTVFPNFHGDVRSTKNLEVVDLGKTEAVRSIRVLVERNDDNENYFTLLAGNATLAVRLSRSAIGVTFRDGASPTSLQSTSSKLLRREIPREVKYLLFSVYVLPDDATLNATHGVNALVTATEAAVQDTDIVTGKELVDPIGLTLPQEVLGVLSHAAINVASSQGHNRTVAFVEQRTVPLSDSSNPHRRSKRCVKDFFYGITTLSAWWWERLFGAQSICVTEASNRAPQAQVDIVTTQPAPTRVDLTVYEADEIGGDNAPDFDVATGMLFCNDRPQAQQATGPNACTMQDRAAIAAIGELSPNTIRSLLERINTYNIDSSSGAAAPLRLTTGNARLDAWLQDDSERAANALSAANNVVQVSDSRTKPNESANLRQRKKKVVKASCADNNPAREAAEQGWECVAKAKRKIRRQDEAIAVPPQLQTGGRYYLVRKEDDSREFNALVRAFLQRQQEMPAGIRADEFASYTEAIAHDGAATGDNLGVVYLNNPRVAPGHRSPYGLNHIWAPGGGGRDNGHRRDWEQLQVNSPETLTRVVMAALTDVDAQYTQSRTADGKVVRTYRRFVFRDRLRTIVFSNIRIVLRQNGMVVTAFPLKNAKREDAQLYM
ncbi:hypothetical protein WJ45_20080 [Burkholderia ubonensis]|nr:hypothetical protein WJ45_20080 [Burkholderia ubonensis]KVQ44375.1 hypothetical protein WK04_15585 [Burkholderia ubonensis]